MLRTFILLSAILLSALATAPLATYALMVSGSRRAICFHYGE